MSVIASELAVQPSPATNIHSPCALRVTQVRSVEELQQVLPQWIAFMEDGVETQNVHNDPQMIETILRAQPSLEPLIYIFWRDAKIECIAPFYREITCFQLELSVWKLWSHRAQVLRLFGERILFAPASNQAACISEILELLSSTDIAFDFLTVFGLPVTDGLWVHGIDQKPVAQAGHLTPIVLRRQKSHQINLPATFDEYLMSLSYSIRKHVRRALRRLAADSRLTIAKFTSAADVDRLLAWSGQVHQHSWQGRTFGRSEQNGEFQRQTLEFGAAQGWLQSYVLLHDNNPVAFLTGQLYRDVYYALDGAYDQQLSSRGPGSTLMFAVIHSLITEHHAAYLDFGFGDMWYKQSLSNVSIDASTIYLVRSKRWHFILHFQVAVEKAYEWVRAGLVRMKVDRFIRKMIKRQR